MKKILVLSALALSVATQASALSCLRPDVVRSYNNAAAADVSFAILLGEFDFSAPAENNAEQGQQVTAQFSGQAMTAQGFDAINPMVVDLLTTCSGSWCGHFPAPGTEVLAFAQQTQNGFILSLGACGGSVFGADEAPIVEACVLGQKCEEGAAFR